MGWDDLLNKKNGSGGQAEGEEAQLEAFERDLIQEVALTMFRMNITKQPTLRFLNDDPGIFEDIFTIHQINSQVQMLAVQNPETYLMVLGCHALGTGVYTVISQLKYNKPVREFGETEINEIEETLCRTDAYEVAINALGFSPTGNNKKCLDAIVVNANAAARRLAGRKMFDVPYQKAYMKVLFNAGVTIIYK